MKRTPLKKNPEKIKAWINKSRKPLNKKGKRYDKRQAMNARLNKLGITQCELHIPKICVCSILLTWAHALKSRFLVTDTDWLRAARSCLPCHDAIERLPHAEMASLVDSAIERRNTA